MKEKRIKVLKVEPGKVPEVVWLKNTLSEIGFQDILIRKRDRIGIQTERIDCDYYRFLKGDIQAVNAFYGEYILVFSCIATSTVPYLSTSAGKGNKSACRR